MAHIEFHLATWPPNQSCNLKGIKMVLSVTIIRGTVRWHKILAHSPKKGNYTHIHVTVLWTIFTWYSLFRGTKVGHQSILLAQDYWAQLLSSPGQFRFYLFCVSSQIHNFQINPVIMITSKQSTSFNPNQIKVCRHIVRTPDRTVRDTSKVLSVLYTQHCTVYTRQSIGTIIISDQDPDNMVLKI